MNQLMGFNPCYVCDIILNGIYEGSRRGCFTVRSVVVETSDVEEDINKIRHVNTEYATYCCDYCGDPRNPSVVKTHQVICPEAVECAVLFPHKCSFMDSVMKLEEYAFLLTMSSFPKGVQRLLEGYVGGGYRVIPDHIMMAPKFTEDEKKGVLNAIQAHGKYGIEIEKQIAKINKINRAVTRALWHDQKFQRVQRAKEDELKRYKEIVAAGKKIQEMADNAQKKREKESARKARKRIGKAMKKAGVKS